MLIRSQDKSIIANVIMIFSKGKKICAQYAANTGWAANEIEVGTYADKETAMKELDNIMNFFNENPKGIYQLK